MYSRIPLYTFILTASLMLSGCGEGQQVSESDYLLRFRAESRMVVESDCNTAGATWSQEDNNLILEQFVTTNNMCPPGTLHNHFVSNLRNIESFTGDASNLVFTTSIPGVTLEFEIRGSGSSQQR
jgi:heat shock protein HslJ